jgi:hypothetical protein
VTWLAALPLACLQVGLLANAKDAGEQTLGAAAWLALAAQMFSNAVFHVVGTGRARPAWLPPSPCICR